MFALETFWPASDGWSAARIEEQLVVTADGCEVITRFPAEDLVIAGKPYFTAGGTPAARARPAVQPQHRARSPTPRRRRRSAPAEPRLWPSARPAPSACRQHRADDPLVAGAPAQVAGDRLADLAPRSARGRRRSSASAVIRKPAVQNPHCSAWCSVNARCRAAELAVGPGQALRRSVSARPSACTASIRQDADRLAVELHRARAAHAVLAADVGAGQPRLVADEVRQQRPRLDLAVVTRCR